MSMNNNFDKVNLTITLVSYKCDKKKLNSCLNSIKIKTDVILIDHSNDLNLKDITVPNNIFLKIIKNENLGNGAGINCGIKNAKTKYVLYLDIDTILPENFFSVLNHTINKVGDFAVLAPKINNFYNNKKIEKYGNLSFLKFYYNKLFFNINRDKSLIENLKQVFFVSGAIMLINKELTLKNNIQFDENIFLYYEEDDFFHQCFKSNLKIFLITNLTAIHMDGSIADDSLQYECFKKWHWEWSKYYFLNKHYNKFLISILAFKNIIKLLVKTCLIFFINRRKFKINLSRLNGLIGFYLKRRCDINY